jgi:PAS domain S-box-containing protein
MAAQRPVGPAASGLRLVVIVADKMAGPPAQFLDPPFSADAGPAVADTVADAVAALASNGAACDAVVIGHGVGRPLDVARQVHLSRRTVPIVLMVASGQVQHFQQMLPFVPHLGDVWIADVGTEAGALRRLIADAAANAQRRSDVSSLYERMNRQLMPAAAASEATRWRLAQSDRFLASILAHAPYAILATDLEGRIVTWNDAASGLFRRETDDAVGRPLMSLFAEAHSAQLTAILDRASAGEVVRADDVQALLPDETTRIAEVIVAPVYGESGRVINLSVIARDITERLAAESQLRQSQKMEAIGQLTGGVAHDFNNLLTVILGNLELLDRHLAGEDRQARELADQAMKAANRGATLVRQLLSFGRRQALRPTAVDLNQLVATMLDLLRRSLGETVLIETRLAPGLEPARVDRNQLENALLNLCLNARDAMPQGGTLTIATARHRVSPAAAPGEPLPGDYVVLAATDTGRGMPPEVQARAFEPFFTTKDVGKGSGLGLSMVYGFAKQSGGHVDLASEVGTGTTVTLYLPIAQRSPEAVAAAVADHAVAGATVLVVEDDPDVRKMAVAMLTDLGCRVMEASDGPSALRILESPARIDLLFADVVMPGGLSGPQLARQATTLRPSLKVLFVSGYSEMAATRDGTDPLGGELLAKPFRKADLALRLRGLLEGA